MTIDASHWGRIVARVNEHARKLHPNNPIAQEELVNELLAIQSPSTLRRQSIAADAALARLKKSSQPGWFAWLRRRLARH